MYEKSPIEYGIILNDEQNKFMIIRGLKTELGKISHLCSYKMIHNKIKSL